MYLSNIPDLDNDLEPQPPGNWLFDDMRSQPSRFKYAAQSQRSYGSLTRYQQRGVARNANLSRDDLKDFAELTIDTLKSGWYKPPGSDEPFNLFEKMTYTNDNTEYYSPDDPVIAGWATADLKASKETKILLKEYSTLVGARALHKILQDRPEVENRIVGVLNFASAKKPGGGFMNGAQAQEESIARSSTLYPSLITPVATQFYARYLRDPDNPYYTHAMVYSPSVTLIRDDRGRWKQPIDVDILTSAAVNAGEIRQRMHMEEEMRLLRARVRAAEAARERQKELQRQRQREWKARSEFMKAERVRKEQEQEQKLKAEEKKKKAEQERIKTEQEKVKAGEGDDITDPDKMDVDEENKEVDVEMKEPDLALKTVDDKSENALYRPKTPQDGVNNSNPWADMVSANDLSIKAPVPVLATAPTLAPPTPNPAEIPLPETPPLPSTSTPPRPPSPLEHHVPLATLLNMADAEIIKEMRERIGRILFLFHKRGAGHLVLGAYGTGVFRNNVEVIAGIFFDFLVKPEGKFHGVFDSIVFAILGEPTIRDFRKVFKGAVINEEEDGEEDDESEEVEDIQDGRADDDGGNVEELSAKKEDPAATKKDVTATKEEPTTKKEDSAKTKPVNKPKGNKSLQSSITSWLKPKMSVGGKEDAKKSTLGNEPEPSGSKRSVLTKTKKPVEKKEEASMQTPLENAKILGPNTQQADVTTKVESEPKATAPQPTTESSATNAPDNAEVDSKPMPSPAPI